VTGVSRRGLLVGGAGLLVGAGATELGDRLSSSGSPAEPRVPSPGEELMVEHGVLKRVLLAYRAMSARLGDGRPLPSGVVTDAAQIVSSYVEGFHEGLEEAYVFPRVRDAEPELVRTLLIEHDRGRHLTAGILTAVGSGFGTAAARAALRADLDSFVRMYEPHEAWEDTVVYPALRAATPQRTLDELAERFADLQNKQFSDQALRQILDRVGGVEQQLGIHDLAAFTPTAD
jgi:hemerythrin-like domain-containing protein